MQCGLLLTPPRGIRCLTERVCALRPGRFLLMKNEKLQFGRRAGARMTGTLTYDVSGEWLNICVEKASNVSRERRM